MATSRPCRLTSFEDESWYYGAISDEEARTALLECKRDGQFIVRDVLYPADDFQYILTVWCAGKIRSYPVAVHEDGKCTLKGLTFLSLEAAVDFFSENELDGVHLVTGIPLSASPPDLGPAIQVIADTSDNITDCDVFLGDDMEETDFCEPVKLQAQVTVEITPHHILESQDRECEAIRLDSVSPPGGHLRPASKDDSMLAPPMVTYSTFKPTRSPSPDVVSPSPAASLDSSSSAMNNSLLAIWPTRKSFHESRASMSNAESGSSGEEEDDSDTDIASDEDAAASTTMSNEVSQSTLGPSQPCSCVSDVGCVVGGVSAISDSEGTPLAVPRVHRSKYARRNHPTITAANKPKVSPSLSVREAGPTASKPSLPSKYSKSEPSILELHHTLEEQLSLRYEKKLNEQTMVTVKPKPIPCEFYNDYIDTFGNQEYLYTPHSRRHSFVFPLSQRGSPHRSQSGPSNHKQRPQSAFLTLPSERNSRGRQRSSRRTIPSLSSLFQKLFRKKSASSPSKPPPKRQGATSHGTTPVRHQMAKEMKSKYSSITKHHWESDSMVVLPKKKGASLN